MTIIVGRDLLDKNWVLRESKVICMIPFWKWYYKPDFLKGKKGRRSERRNE